MREPVISIIMGVYNCKSPQKFIRSVESIIKQTFQDWELIICDDGSTDQTLSLLRATEKIDSRITVLHYDKNVSLGNALNECIKKARGAFIARQDDDDLSEPSRLQREYEFLLKNQEYCMVGCCAKIYDDNGVWGHYHVPVAPEKVDFYRNSPFMHPTMMIRRGAIDAVRGYRVSKETRRCEDYDMFMRMYAKGYKGANLQDELYQYYMVYNDPKMHRPMKYRIDEAKVRYIGFKNMGILKGGLPYIVKPIIAGLIPAKVFSKVQNKQYYK